MLPNIKARFHDEMLSLYQKTKKELGYNATRFLRIVNEQGGLGAAKTLFLTDGYSEGLTILWEKGRLDLTMEALVLSEPWVVLFSEDELA